MRADGTKMWIISGMERLSLAEAGLDTCVRKAAAVLRAGGVVLYPTDTLYGLGGDAFSDEAVKRVCDIKGRDERRPMHAVFADMEMVRAYADVTPLGERLAARFLPGPLTLIFSKREGVFGGIARDLPTIGVRIPRHEFCIALSRAAGPYTTTSANRSGAGSPAGVPDVLSHLGKEAAMIDLVIDGGPVDPSLRSTVVDARDAAPLILREGAISREAIEEVAG